MPDIVPTAPALSDQAITIAGYRPGAIGRIVELHGRCYAETCSLGAGFEIEVASELAEFMSRLDRAKNRLWIAEWNSEVVGAVALDAATVQQQGARLRWFIVAPLHRGKGVGRILLETALAFSREEGFPRVFIWACPGLDAATHLYKLFGFRLDASFNDRAWGRSIRHDRYVIELAKGNPGPL